MIKCIIMQKRRSERIPVDIPAKITMGDKTYSGTIINVSEDGVGSAVTSVIELHEQFKPVSRINLFFLDQADRRIDIECELAWFSRSSIDERHITIGMKIINPTVEYMDFIQSTHSRYLLAKTKEQLVAELMQAHRTISELLNRQRAISSDLGKEAYRAIIESTDDSIYVVDKNMRYVFMNRKHISRLGLEASEYLKHSYREFHPAQDADEFESKANDVFATGKPITYEHYSSIDNRHYLRTISPIFDEEDSINSISVISKNITDRSLAEELLLRANRELDRQVRERAEALQKLNEELRNEIIERKLKEEGMKKASNDWRITFDSTRDMILMLDKQSRIVKLNKAAADFMKRSFDRLIGQNFFDVFSTSDINMDCYPLVKTLDSGRHEEAEIHLKSRDIWIHALVDPVKDEYGNVTGAVHIIRDITEQKNLHSQLLHAQKMESIGRLAGGIAHDFNNILSAIMGYTELSLLKLPEDSLVKNYLTLIKEGSEKAAVLTQRLLAFSRKQLLQIKPVDLNAVIEGMMKMVSRILREDIIVDLNLAPSVKMISADQIQVEQIIMNLIVNARDAMPGGGRITIATSNVNIDEAFIIRHEHAVPGPYVLIVVSDTGIGIPRQIQERIFEPFFTTKGMGEGTGLGLATVYGIVKQHNGYIYVYSEEGRGTTFKIYMPVSETEAKVVSTPEQIMMTGGTETILVVDDDNFVRSLIKDIFSPLGYNLLFAYDGEDALSVVKNSKCAIDLLLTDIIMPNMNGKLLAEHFRKEYPDTKIIFMSGYTEETLSGQADLELGDMLIQKPISPSLLASSIREVLDKK